jgi:predicted DNA-binding transcriptional regulator YafY
MRADRLLAGLLLLQAHGRLPAREIAERLEVSERTVHRDMEALAMAGVPVYAERGRNGGWALDEDYRTDLTGLTEAELRSVVVATMPGVLADLGLAEAADRALLKLLAGLPAARRRAAEAPRAYLHIDPSGWRRPDESAPFLPMLDLALRTGRRVRITYERATDRSVVERDVDPLGLVAKGSTWYLVALVEGATRTYRASRLRDVRVLEEPADRPADLDLAEVWGRSQAEFRAALPRYDATIRYAPEAMPRVRLGWRFARLESEAPPDPDGWVACRIRADSIEVAIECALGLGVLAEVVEPAELRDRVRDAAAAVVHRDAARILRG